MSLNNLIRKLNIYAITNSADSDIIIFYNNLNKLVNDLIIINGNDGFIHCRSKEDGLVIKLSKTHKTSINFSFIVCHILNDKLKKRISYVDTKNIVAVYICKKYNIGVYHIA